ncbi:DUF401 family protein [Desulfoglaeba alkanexedens]|uniref:DUF401 family protein n=1 Tax=Desulfoglaeba alkanexedens ALDC TaxID=980445 RepID=A0A4P8L5G4_9BACT|nr:DUF401 family protein [Desulfoglaeba alkanexedens]QCQ23276.1 DUF401 family protein [Desulfoglaeba alkanexedens ALDC]
MLESVPAIIRVLVVFVVILIAIRRRFSLGNAFISGAVLLGLLFGMNPKGIALSTLSSLVEAKTMSLSGVVCLILVLSHSLEAAGQMERLLARFQGLIHRPRINLVVFPALIGLLPMPGGAIFSAPMVKTLGKRLRLSGDQLSYINYWFRHIWEYWWPLYPGVLLTTALADLHLWLFVAFLFPLTLVALFSGYLPLRTLNNGATAPEADAREPAPSLKPFLKELAPILIVIGGGLGMGSAVSLVLGSGGTGVDKELGLIAALVAGILWVWRANGLSHSQCWDVLKRRQLLQMFYMVASIMIFKGVLEDSEAVGAISDELLLVGIPLMPVTVILPFLVGSVVGITIGFVGTTFPILISLIQSFGESQHMLAYMMLGLVSGFVGVLLSPLHLCLLLSNEYFETALGYVYRHLVAPCGILLASGCAYFFLLQALF